MGYFEADILFTVPLHHKRGGSKKEGAGTFSITIPKSTAKAVGLTKDDVVEVGLKVLKKQ
jgi:hypothetical protein